MSGKSSTPISDAAATRDQLLLKTMLNNITAIKARHQGKWFDPGALAWFNSTFPARTVYPVPDGAYFISREYSKGVYISTGWIPDGPVGWTVRFCSDEGRFDSDRSRVSGVRDAERPRPRLRRFRRRTRLSPCVRDRR